jgi:hypothetical protein
LKLLDTQLRCCSLYLMGMHHGFNKKTKLGTKACSPAVLVGFLYLCILVQVSACASVTPAVFYLPTGLAGCSVDPEISRDARKLARTPRVIKKKKRLNWYVGSPCLISTAKLGGGEMEH